MADENREIIIRQSGLEEHAKEIDRKNKAMTQKLMDIKDEINRLKGGWESDSASTIRNKITGMVPRFEEYSKVVNSYAVFIRNVAGEAENMEKTLNSNASRFK